MPLPCKPMSHQEELLRAFHIRIEDLEANRIGRLGDAQLRSLLNSGNWSVAGALFIGFLLAIILYGVAAKPLAPIQWILCILLFAAALTVGMGYFRQMRAAVTEGRVECLVGPVRVGSRGRGGWFLTVAGQSFRLPSRPWHVKQGQEYRVYIAPRTRGLVAMEPIGDG